MTAGDLELGVQLAATLAEKATAEHRALVRASVALLCRERGLGHVCIALADHAGNPTGAGNDTFPATSAWREALLASGTATSGDQPLPLVVDSAARLYLRRDHRSERRIVAALRQRLSAPQAIDPRAVRSALDELGLLPTTDGTIDWQLAAVAAGAATRFLLLTGGPGTGKTTTVARLLSLLLRLDPALRIALCAPTGKAAARLGEAIARHAEHDSRLRGALPGLQPRTLHRLLGYRPLDDTFHHGSDRRLAIDAVVVDEASMLDPALLAALLDALPDAARLILVGDRDQLAAVAAGQILGDLCRAAAPDRGVGERLGGFVAAATGVRPPVQENAAAIADAVIALRVNHRFGAQPGLDHFARALADRDPPAALAVLDGPHADLSWADHDEEVLAEIEPDLLAAVRAAPDRALAHLDRLRILAASRHGGRGTLAWNRRVEALLAGHGVRSDEPWYRGRPILVTANDHQNRIYNGDLGVVCRDHAGRPQVAFSGPDGGVRLISTFRLPAHETAWAMTVHKAQGSEFDTTVLSMPDADGPLWQAPLLYTGITRARKRAILLADRELLSGALGRWPTRSSGLAAELAE